jgi:hypothetical protein
VIGAFSTFQIEQWMDDLQAADIWLGLGDDDPFGVGDPLTVEIAGGGYARPGPVTFARPGPKQLRVASISTWTGLTPGTTVRSIMGFDASTNGNMRFAVFPAEEVTITTSGLYVLAADSLYVGVDV